MTNLLIGSKIKYSRYNYKDTMNRVLPITIIVLVGIGILSGAFWFLKGRSTPIPQANENKGKEETLKELLVSQKPYASLTPRADGRELHLVVSKLPKDASAMEYELVYTVESGITQGVPGNVKDIAGKTSVERDLLLGTCSSGKCRYDEGVEQGTFTIRFRDTKGKLVYKFETGFNLQQNPAKITSIDGKFTLSGTMPKGYYLTMGTFGLPDTAPGEVTGGPYGVFTKASGKVTAVVSLGINIQVYATSWKALTDNKTSTLGVFAAIE